MIFNKQLEIQQKHIVFLMTIDETAWKFWTQIIIFGQKMFSLFLWNLFGYKQVTRFIEYQIGVASKSKKQIVLMRDSADGRCKPVG